MHELRDANGILKAKLDNVATGRILEGSTGHWKDFQSKDRPHVNTIFVLDEGGVYSASNGSVIIFLWKGDFIIAE